MGKKIWLTLHPRNFGTVRPSARPSPPQGNHCEISHFLASMGACNLCLKGLSHPTRMREPMKTNLKKSGRLFQDVSEILEGCVYLSKSQPSFNS